MLGRDFDTLQSVGVGPPEVFLALANGGAEKFLTSQRELLEAAQAELEAAAGMQQRCRSPANSVGTDDVATDDASALADTDGGRTRRTRTDLDGVDSWQVPDTGVVPQSPPGPAEIRSRPLPITRSCRTRRTPA
jgi:hypothetical protein